MKIAAVITKDQIAQSVTQADQILIVEAEDKAPTSKEVLEIGGQEITSVLLKLAARNIDVLLANDVSTVLQGTLHMLGISLYPGCQGDANEQIAAYLLGEDIGDPSKVALPEEDENDPMACMHDCSRCMAECSTQSPTERAIKQQKQ